MVLSLWVVKYRFLVCRPEFALRLVKAQNYNTQYGLGAYWFSLWMLRDTAFQRLSLAFQFQKLILLIYLQVILP